MKLGRNLLLRDVFVMRRKRISLKAEWAYPYPRAGVNRAVEVSLSEVEKEGNHVRERIEYGSAGLLASYWFIL